MISHRIARLSFLVEFLLYFYEYPIVIGFVLSEYFWLFMAGSLDPMGS
jgi:hypothetical protein